MRPGSRVSPDDDCLVSHVAISVPDLEPAEAYYRALFAMEVVTREALGPDGDLQLPSDRGWDDARRAGVDLYMVALRAGDFVLALFDEASPMVRELGLKEYRPLFVGLVMREEEIGRVRTRLTDEERDEDSGGFRDRYGNGLATELQANLRRIRRSQRPMGGHLAARSRPPNCGFSRRR